MLAALIDSQVVAAITPQVATGLRSAPTQVAASVTIYAVAAATVALLLGRFAPRVDAVVWLPRAALLFVVANLLATFAPRLAIFWTARALAGFAGGLVSALAIAALANASAYKRRGRQMSGVAISYFLAPVLGVPVGTWLAGRFGWRVVFGATAVLVGLTGLLVRQFPLRAATEQADTTTDAQTDATTDSANAATRAQTKSEASLGALWRLAWRSSATRRGIVSAFFISGGLVGLTTYLGAWLFDAFHEGPREVGAIYAVAGLGAVVGGAAGGMLADLYGKRRVAIGSSVLMVALLVLLPSFNRGTALWILIGVTAFVAALRVAPLQALITELVAPAERATYVALRNGMSQLGIAVAVAVGARFYPRFGLMGVALWCALLTLGAWLSLRKLHEPQGESATAERAGAASDSPRVVARRSRRVLRKLAYVVCVLALLIVVGLPWLLSFAVTKAGTRPDERRRTDTPAQQGASYEDVAFTSTDSNQLSGWYLPARTHGVTVIMTHGLFRSRYEMLDRGIELWRAGYGVLLYDLRRHGRSPAEFSTIGYDERHDVAAAVAFVRARAPGQKIVLMGVSMGAAATLLAAAEAADDKDIIAVVADSSFLSFTDTVRHHVSLIHLPRGVGVPPFPFATLLIKFTAWRMNFRADDFDLLRAVRQIKRPVLFIGGTNDQRMPIATVLEPLYAAATSPLKRKLIVADEKATHGHAYDADPAGYIAAVREFLQTAEQAAQAAP